MGHPWFVGKTEIPDNVIHSWQNLFWQLVNNLLSVSSRTFANWQHTRNQAIHTLRPPPFSFHYYSLSLSISIAFHTAHQQPYLFNMRRLSLENSASIVTVIRLTVFHLSQAGGGGGGGKWRKKGTNHYLNLVPIIIWGELAVNR